MHYAVWLHAVPQEQTRGNATLTCLAAPAAALLGSPVGVKDLYLSLSSFHAYLELAAAAAFFVGGVRPAASAKDSTCS